MKNITSIVVMSLLSMTVVSCGKKAKAKAEEQSNTFEIEENQKLSEFTTKLRLDTTTPAGLATLLGLKKSNDKTEVEACTSFLIDKNTILTNSHCIPQSIKDFPDQDCGKIIQLAIKTDTNVIKTKCQKVIKYSSILDSVARNNDYALIKIASDISLKKYFTLERSGFSENDKVIVWSLNHTLEDGIIDSRFAEQNCIIKSSDSFGTINSLASSPVVAFKEKQTSTTCKSLHGNSGSPVITNSYSFVGILHGGYFPKETDRNSITKNITPNLGIVTNFRCQLFNYEALDRDLPPGCAQENQLNNSATDKKVEVQVETKMKDFTDKILKDLSGVVEYKLISDSLADKKHSLSFFPKCIHPLEFWAQSDLDKIQKSFGKKSFTMETASYVINMTVDFDYYGNTNVTLSQSFAVKNTFELSNLQKLGANKSAKMITKVNIGRDIETQLQICQ